MWLNNFSIYSKYIYNIYSKVSTSVLKSNFEQLFINSLIRL